MQKILTKQMMMIFLLIRTLTGTQIHILYLDMKYGNRVLNKGQKRLPSFIKKGLSIQLPFYVLQSNSKEGNRGP